MERTHHPPGEAGVQGWKSGILSGLPGREHLQAGSGGRERGLETAVFCLLTHSETHSADRHWWEVGCRAGGVLLLRLRRPHVSTGGVGIKCIRVGAVESGPGVGWGSDQQWVVHVDLKENKLKPLISLILEVKESEEHRLWGQRGLG